MTATAQTIGNPWPDLVISGGLVVDGTGAAGRPADVGVTAGLITEVAAPRSLRGASVVDAAGSIVAPGFFDIHSHADFTIALDGRAQSALQQGVTSIVTGNCGHGAAPLPRAGLPTGAGSVFGWRAEDRPEASWRDFTGYLAVLRRQGVGVNVFPLIAHTALRATVLDATGTGAGTRFRTASRAEIARMAALVREAMGAGAVGVSTATEYAPGSIATRSELTALSVAAGEYGGLYATHCRDRGAGIIQATEEALEVAQDGGCRLQLSHFLRRPGFRDHDAYRRARDLVRSAGYSALFDAFPFRHGPTSLSVILPDWVREGTREQVASRLADPALRSAITSHLADRFGAAHRSGSALELRIVSDGRDGSLGAVTLGELSEGRPTADIVLALLAAAGENFFDVTVAEPWATWPDLEAALSSDDYLVMGDGVTAADDGPLRGRRFCLSDWGYAPMMLAAYVRDRSLVPLEHAIHRMTMAPARQAGVPGRGVIVPGYAADLVVFDLGKLSATADPARIGESAGGVLHVVVNGQLAVRDGWLTGARAGLAGIVRSSGIQARSAALPGPVRLCDGRSGWRPSLPACSGQRRFAVHQSRMLGGLSTWSPRSRPIDMTMRGVRVPSGST